MPLRTRNTQEKPIYGGWLVHHPDGSPMFRCADERANWYLSRSLAKQIKVDGEQKAIQLTFVPKGRGQCGDQFFMTPKSNLCVCCGATGDLTRHHVVPYMYRKHFPETAKANNHHDVVLLCLDCHHKYEQFAEVLKSQLATTYNAPLPSTLKFLSPDKDVSLAKSAVMALSRHGTAMPPEVADQKRKIISDYLGHPVTDKELESFAIMVEQEQDEIKESHPLKVLEQVTDLQEFVELWRQHFLTSMSPKHMPSFWDVKRKFDDIGSADRN